MHIKEFLKKNDLALVILIPYILFFIVSELRLSEETHLRFWTFILPGSIGCSFGVLIYWVFAHKKYKLSWKLPLCFFAFNIFVLLVNSSYAEFLLQQKIFIRVIIAAIFIGLGTQYIRPKR